MATTTSPAGSGRSKQVLAGCGLGCGVLLALLVVLLGTSIRKTQRTGHLVKQFVSAAAMGDLDQAYGMLGTEAVRADTADQFKAKWMITRTALGSVQRVEAAGSGTMDLKNSTFTVPMRVVGDKVRVKVAVTVNPNDDPPKVLAYKLEQER